MNQKVFCQNEYTKQAISGIIAFNKRMIGIIQNKYESIKEERDKIQNKFTESKLKRISTQNMSMTDETSNGQEQVTFHLN